MLPLKDLMIVENQHFLLNDEDEDVGFAVALVDIESVHPWQWLMKLMQLVQRIGQMDICHGSSIMFVHSPHRTIAKRKLYRIELNVVSAIFSASIRFYNQS